MRLVVLMLNTEPVTAGVRLLVIRNLVANDVDESLDLGLLRYY